MKFIVIAAAAATVASAAPSIAVDNHCSFPLYLTSAFGSAPNDGVHTLATNTLDAYNTPVTDSNNDQHALTISLNPDMSSPLQNIYNVAGNPQTIYYSLSTIYGDPLKMQGFQLDSLGNGFDIVSPPNRTGDPANCYSPSNPNGDHAVFTETDGANFVLSLCG